MRIADLNTGTGQLREALETLQIAWGTTRDYWKDSNARNIEEQHLTPLAIEVTAAFPVIMNLTEMDEPDAKRLVDFAAGLAFGLRGSMERVTNRVFLLSPPNIQVSAEDKARIAEGGFFQQP